VERIINAAGVKVRGFDSKDAFYGYMNLEWKGKKFHLGLGGDKLGSEQGIRGVKSALMNMSKVEKTYESLKGISDPFYSDINGLVKTHFGGGEGRHVAYDIVCQWLENDGVRIWS